VVEVALARRAAGDAPEFRLDAAFEADAGITVVCGASGTGKTSLLLALLGALRPERGRIALAGRALFDAARGTDLPVRSRRVGMVFQDAPLFPHLDVRSNVAFGMTGSGRSRRAEALLEHVGALDLARRRPSELSGGQRQRVALARALAGEPAALLLDEPFSALDAPARESLGRLLVALQGENPIPFVHVTHDLAEALRLGRRLVLLGGGRVVQTGTPAEVIARPASVAAARAVGTENLLSGTVRAHRPDEGCTEVEIEGTTVLTALLDLQPGERVMLGLRAEDLLLSLRPVRETSARNVLAGTLRELRPHGPGVELRVTTPASFRLLVTPASVRELALEPGKEVHLLIKAAAFHVLR
jgi:molybdate transport system ATP-binding protein